MYIVRTVTAILAFLVVSLLFVQNSEAQDPAELISAGAIVSGAQAVIQQLQNLGATWTGDGGILINGTVGQLSGLLGQFQKAVGDNIASPLNSFGYDIQALGKRINVATSQLNQILTHQRNCGFQNATALISGIRNVGLLASSNIPLAGSGSPRIDYFQFVGHNPEIVPRDGGDAIVFGYRLWVDDEPDVSLLDAQNNQIRKLTVTRGPNDDSVQVSMPGNVLVAESGKVLTLNVLAHEAEKFWFIRYGTKTTEMRLPFAVPSEYVLKYKTTGQVSYKCTRQQNENLATVTFDFHNSSCEDRHNIGPDPRTPQLTSGPDIKNAQIVGFHFVNWPDGHSSPNTRNQSNVQVSTGTTTVSAAGWLDTASCVCGPLVGCKLLHDTFWQAAVVPEERFDAATGTTEPEVTDVVDAAVPTTASVLSFNSSCSEQGVRNMKYSVVPIVNGQAQQPIYESPFINGSEKGVFDKQTLGALELNATWNPQPVGGKTQMQVTITNATCGY